MHLDIKLVKSSSMFCIEGIVATVASWLNRNFEMMFVDMWGFKFLESNISQHGLIGTNLSADFDTLDTLEMVEKYHGIRVVDNKITNIELLMNLIENELSKGMPVSLRISNKYCPWINRDDDRAYLLVIGLDEKNNLICLDVHNGLTDPKLLPMQQLIDSKGVEDFGKITCSTFQVVSDESKDISLNSFISCLDKKMSLNQGIFDNIRQLAECIEKKLDFILEKGNISNPYDIPLLYNIMQISRARKLISTTLEYIGKISGEEECKNMSSEFLIIGGEWNTIWNVLIKAYYFPKMNSTDLKLNIADRIRRIANNEEQLIKGILDNEYNQKERTYISRETKTNYSFINTIYLDISNHLNNKAFAETEENIECANFTGNGEFFLTEGLPENRIINVSGVAYQLTKSKNSNDNISCCNQIIEVPPGTYKRIMILGCSEWGNGFGNVEITYSDDNVENLMLHFPDWFYEGVNDAERAWTGNIISFTGKKEKRSLFSLGFFLGRQQNIKKIVLPDSTNTHVFAISLEGYNSI